jgi:hypothetical protein
MKDGCIVDDELRDDRGLASRFTSPGAAMRAMAASASTSSLRRKNGPFAHSTTPSLADPEERSASLADVHPGESCSDNVIEVGRPENRARRLLRPPPMRPKRRRHPLRRHATAPATTLGRAHEGAGYSLSSQLRSRGRGRFTSGFQGRKDLSAPCPSVDDRRLDTPASPSRCDGRRDYRGFRDWRRARCNRLGNDGGFRHRMTDDANSSDTCWSEGHFSCLRSQMLHRPRWRRRLPEWESVQSRAVGHLNAAPPMRMAQPTGSPR